MDELWTMIAAKVTGSVGGAMLALLFQPPKTINEGKRRAAISLLAGLTTGELLRQFYNLPPNFEMWMASAAIISAGSWWVIGAAIRVIAALGGWKPK